MPRQSSLGDLNLPREKLSAQARLFYDLNFRHEHLYKSESQSKHDLHWRTWILFVHQSNKTIKPPLEPSTLIDFNEYLLEGDITSGTNYVSTVSQRLRLHHLFISDPFAPKLVEDAVRIIGIMCSDAQPQKANPVMDHMIEGLHPAGKFVANFWLCSGLRKSSILSIDPALYAESAEGTKIRVQKLKHAPEHLIPEIMVDATTWKQAKRFRLFNKSETRE